jgi:hypothetical protein
MHVSRVSNHVTRENRQTRSHNERWLVRSTFANHIEEKPYKTEGGARREAAHLLSISKWDSPLLGVEVINLASKKETTHVIREWLAANVTS